LKIIFSLTSKQLSVADKKASSIITIMAIIDLTPTTLKPVTVQECKKPPETFEYKFYKIESYCQEQEEKPLGCEWPDEWGKGRKSPFPYNSMTTVSGTASTTGTASDTNTFMTRERNF